jgi:hypothetical protein
MMRQGPRSGSRNQRPTRSAPSKVGERREAVGSGTDGRRVGIRRERGDQESEKGSRKCERGQWRRRKHENSGSGQGKGKDKIASAMLGPRLAGEGRVEGDDKLAGGVDGMGGKVVGSTMETMVGGERGVEGPGSEVVKVELGLGEQVVPSVRREGDTYMYGKQRR